MKGSPRPPLRRKDLLEHPSDQFLRWLEDVREDGRLQLPDAGCLSTADPESGPDGRMVLLKGCDRKGFVFYTNLESRKARQIEADPRAALTFYWESLRRQVRVRGDVEPVEAGEADEYFARRPRGSKLGAWASEQSRPVEERAGLDRRFAQVEARFEDGEIVPRPPFWSGFRVRPRSVEFWQERRNRLHDRFRYDRTEDGWIVTRLQP